MEQVYYSLLGFLFINFVYLFFKFLIAIILGVHDEQIFLGYGHHEAFKIRIKKLTIYFGLFIPLPWLAKFYSYKNETKGRITFEWEFFEKSKVFRMLVIFAGTIGSLLTSILIFTILSYQELDQYISKEELNKFGIFPSEFAESSGFKKGDLILKVNGEDYDRFEDLLSPLTLLNDSSYYEILREKDTLILQSSWDLDKIAENASFIFAPNAPYEIMGLVDGMPAAKSGMKEGDIITKIDSINVSSQQEIKNVFALYSGDTVEVQVKRDKEFLLTTLKVSEDGMIGYYSVSLIEYSLYQKNIPEAFIEGVSSPFKIIGINLKALAQLLGAEVATNKKANGPVRIANLFGDRNTAQFFRISALLLALIPLWDLFPFPKSAALKSMPLIYEIAFERRFKYESFIKIRRVGWFIIVTLFAVTIINDIVSLF